MKHATDQAAAPGGHLIGPNAVLQFLPVLEARVGAEETARLLRLSRIDEIPDGSCMIDEAQVARLHQTVRRELPALSAALSRLAGAGTADYIMANRIPGFARAILGVLPARLAEPMLAGAIARHAWTFAGSGSFRVAGRSPLVFEIHGNPVVRRGEAAQPVCDWHGAVFRRLFEQMIGAEYHVEETSCSACGGDCCRFEVRRLRAGSRLAA
jgi:divinyl protochlorophyllide a 8-vinyl-reductase